MTATADDGREVDRPKIYGWTVWGNAGGELGDRDPGPRTRAIHEPIEWPEAELSNSLASIVVRIHSYGDDPNGAFVKVVGVDRERAQEAYRRAALLVERFAGVLFGGEA